MRSNSATGRLRGIAVLATVAALLVTGCSRSESSGEGEGEGAPNETGRSESSAVSGDFGDLEPVCGEGDPTSSPAQGVTADAVKVGLFSDIGFTKNTEFVDAANVFTEWCNAQGGIAGRAIELTVHDTRLTEVRQRMIEACRDDFAIVGGGAALDGLGVRDRLDCLMPSFPAQTSQPTSVGADLEVRASPSQLPGYDSYTGFRRWLTTEAHPESKDRLGLILGDSPITKNLGDRTQEALEADGGTVVSTQLYPAVGLSDWSPYAQQLKSSGVRGLIFYGDPRQIPKLEESLRAIDYRLDWIDSTNNSYNDSFLNDLGPNAEFQNNYADLGGVAPVDSANDVPAVRKVLDLFAEYAPDAQFNFPQMRAMSAWLLFAKSASSCGDDLTRRCLYDAATAEKEWTAGGLHAPIDQTPGVVPSGCFNVQEATGDGWQAADFGPDTDGLYRCDVTPYKFVGDFGTALTLADVGKSMSDFQ